MSSTANKLCSGGQVAGLTFFPSPCNHHNGSISPQKPTRKSDKPTRSVVIEKQTIVKNLGILKTKLKPNISNKYASRELILQKYFEDIAVNTTVSGALQWDNPFMTKVRLKDENEYHEGRNIKDISCDPKKYILVDKACSQIIQTVSCGTQFFEDLKPNSNSSINQREVGMQVMLSDPLDFKSSLKSTGLKIQCLFNQITAVNSLSSDNNICNNKILRYNFKPTNRWALSRNPIMGPDF